MDADCDATQQIDHYSRIDFIMLAINRKWESNCDKQIYSIEQISELDSIDETMTTKYI